jgi:membrane fusion protein (multidrug efflux system)
MALLRLLAFLCVISLLAACGSESPGAKGDAKSGDAKGGNDKDAKAAKGDAKGKGPAGGFPGMGGPVQARVLEVQPQRVPIRLESVAQVEGSREVEVRARVGGTVLKRAYSEGAPVKAGVLMFQIDPAPFEIALAQARALLAQERARNEQARRESGRMKDLATQKAISQREYDDATSGLKLSDASIQAAEARVREAELNLSYTQVTAPVSGVSGRAQRSEGSLVSAADNLLTTISQISPVWVRFAFAEPEVARLPGARIGPDADVRLVLGDGSRYAAKGRINFAESRVDARLGTRQMRAEFDNPSGQLLPGQFVRVEVSVNRPQAVVLVPQSAVLQGEKGYMVFALDAESKAAPRPIQVGEWSGTDWVVLGGLKPGDRVVLDNLMKLQPGVPVEPIVEKPQGPAAKAEKPNGAAKAAPANGKK